MNEYRCPHCDRVLFEYYGPLKLRIRCRRCGAWNDVNLAAPAAPAKEAINGIDRRTGIPAGHGDQERVA